MTDNGITNSDSMFITSEKLKFARFSPTVLLEPTMVLTLQEGKLYQLWHCKMTDTKEWKEITSYSYDIPFQHGQFGGRSSIRGMLENAGVEFAKDEPCTEEDWN
jgi:hypothetical protein